MAGYYSEVMETIEDPDSIYEGNSNELLAVKEIQKDKHIVVVYKEVNEEDGFVITAFLSSRKKQLERRTKVWQRQK